MHPLAPRIVRRFVEARQVAAATLTKQWLMAVRRGWIQLMRPKIRDYADVIEAFGKLTAFVENLREEVLNVRRGPYTSVPTMSDGERLEWSFKVLKEQIKEALSTARHWRDCYEGKSLGDCRADGAKMLALYQTNFEGAASRSKKLRDGRFREAFLTEFFDDVLAHLYEDAKRIREHDEHNPGVDLDVKRPVYRSFHLGRAKVIVVDAKMNGTAIERYVPQLEMAYTALKNRGFDRLWYGTIFLVQGDSEKLSPAEQQAYAEAGYAKMEARAGTYHSGEDIVRLTAAPEHAYAVVVHEMGHRYWFKFMTPAKRARFEMLVEGTFTKVHALLLNEARLTEEERAAFSEAYEKLERGMEPSVAEKVRIDAKYKELGLRAAVPLVSEYAASDIREAFAEVFERYVVARDLPREQVDSLKQVLAFAVADQTRQERCGDFAQLRRVPCP